MNGQSRFSGFCPYLHYTLILGYVNKTCTKSDDFTGFFLPNDLQNRFPVENESVPSPDGVPSIFS